MIKKLLLLTFLAFTFNIAHAQTYQQYFDGADTGATSIIVQLDTSSSNIWQVGRPQKNIFDSAATAPNALVTDTINTYPKGNISWFTIGALTHNWGNGSVIAIRWKQKLDLDTNHDGGIVEYSIDTGKTWLNVFNNPNVYNFYGFDSLVNKDTLQTGEFAFSGTDTVWRDIWLCFLSNATHGSGSLILRYTLKTDTVDNNREGWMIDNMMTQLTIFHTVSKLDPNKTFLVYPTITSGIIKVAMGDTKAKIESILVLDSQGRVVKRQNGQSDKATVDISGLADGNYFVHVHSGEKIEVHKVLLTK